MQQDTKLFFVVDSPESNEEIFETYGEACDYSNSLRDWRTNIRIALVNNAYREEIDGKWVWNYEDEADTFINKISF